MDMYAMIQMLASMGMLTIKDAMEYVRIGTITPDQYRELVGETYIAPTA